MKFSHLIKITFGFLAVLFLSNCSKLDSTTLGADEVAIDNINTFADTFAINVTQHIFSNDSFIIARTESAVLGKITNDPLFGKTDAQVYTLFKPTIYPFKFAADTQQLLNFDSAFLTLNVNGLWGDTSLSNSYNFEVNKVSDPRLTSKPDSFYRASFVPYDVDANFGSTTQTLQTIKNYQKRNRGKDSVKNQIRIKLNSNFLTYMQGMGSASNQPLYNDSLYRANVGTFEIKVNSGSNTLFYLDLWSAASSIEFYYRVKNINSNTIDTTVRQFFAFQYTPASDVKSSPFANYISQNYSGTQVPAPAANDIYIQGSPGTYAMLSIPGLANYSNRIIRRAYIQAEEKLTNTATDNIFLPPPYLYLDLLDSIATTPPIYKPIYNDLDSRYISYDPDYKKINGMGFLPSGGIDIQSFGGNAQEVNDAQGKRYKYEMNITRYIQRYVSNANTYNYKMRLYAPNNLRYPQYLSNSYYPFYNQAGSGRVLLQQSSNYRTPGVLKLIVVYSKF